jgi:hypothetical protein
MLLTRYVFMIRLEGGRGHVAPYETTHVRIPKPLKEPITLLIEDYKEYVRVGGNPDAYEYPPPPPRGEPVYYRWYPCCWKERTTS